MCCIKVGHNRFLSLSILLFAAIIEGFTFITEPSLAVLPHINPASAGKFSKTFRAYDSDKRESLYYLTLSRPAVVKKSVVKRLSVIY